MLPAVTTSTTKDTAAVVADSYFRPYYYNFVAGDALACSPISSFGSDTGVGTGLHSHCGYTTTASSPAVLNLDGVADHQAFDIDCPWEIDAVLSQCTQAPTTDQCEP